MRAGAPAVVCASASRTLEVGEDSLEAETRKLLVACSKNSTIVCSALWRSGTNMTVSVGSALIWADQDEVSVENMTSISCA